MIKLSENVRMQIEKSQFIGKEHSERLYCQVRRAALSTRRGLSQLIALDIAKQASFPLVRCAGVGFPFFVYCARFEEIGVAPNFHLFTNSLVFKYTFLSIF